MALVIALVSLALIALGWWRLMTDRSGERCVRRAVRGPFVPLGDEPKDQR